jgi:hypothetical protein
MILDCATSGIKSVFDLDQKFADLHAFGRYEVQHQKIICGYASLGDTRSTSRGKLTMVQ